VTGVTAAVLSGLDGWSPHTVTSVETIESGPVTALSALLDSNAPAVRPADVLPALWHWVALPRWPVSSELGLDGHPRRGEFLPPLDLPRRMFAGGQVTLHGDLRVGATVVRESVVDTVEAKEGRSGPFAVVRVTTLLRDPGGAVLVEEHQDLVYRGSPPPSPAPADPAPAAAQVPMGPPLRAEVDHWRFVTDPTLLMRFSAATANAHRIHYDWPYSTKVEGYPGLVVHGPLSTLVLAEALRMAVPQRRLRHLRHRNVAPLFCGEDAWVHLRTDTDLAKATLRGGDGTLLAGLSAELSPDTPKGISHA
jgi:3-methylfumaryl-CoA hydratase